MGGLNAPIGRPYAELEIRAMVAGFGGGVNGIAARAVMARAVRVLAAREQSRLPSASRRLDG
jgi:hypothetical protein